MNTLIAKVYVNNIEVGSLPIDQVRKIEKAVEKDWKLHVSQAFNHIWILSNFTLKAFIVIPTIWFAVLLLTALFNPSDITNILTALQSTSPEELTKPITSLLFMSFFLALFINTIVCVCRGFTYFGYENKFKSAFNHAIKDILEVPDKGEVLIINMPVSHKHD